MNLTLKIEDEYPLILSEIIKKIVTHCYRWRIVSHANLQRNVRAPKWKRSKSRTYWKCRYSPSEQGKGHIKSLLKELENMLLKKV